MFHTDHRRSHFWLGNNKIEMTGDLDRTMECSHFLSAFLDFERNRDLLEMQTVLEYQSYPIR